MGAAISKLKVCPYRHLYWLFVSGVRALPLEVSVEQSLHYFLDYSLSFFSSSRGGAFLLVRMRSPNAHACGAFMSTAQLQLNELN